MIDRSHEQLHDRLAGKEREGATIRRLMLRLERRLRDGGEKELADGVYWDLAGQQISQELAQRIEERAKELLESGDLEL